MGSVADSPAKSPLGNSAFRALWLAAVFSFVGTWVQDVGQSWLMLTLTSSPLPVAMLGTMTTAPAFVLMLPAGLLADRFDRRTLIMAAQTLAAVVAGLLAVATWAGFVSPAALLMCSFGLGVSSALTVPPWQSLLPDLVPRAQTAQAVTLNSLAFNLARAIGPALGGLLLGAAGPGWAFAFNAVSFVAVIDVLRRFDSIKEASRVTRDATKEPLLRALFAAIVYAWRSRHLRAMLASASAFGLGAAGFMALLPVFAKTELHTSASGYGALLGAIGGGAVTAALLLRTMRSRLRTGRLVSGAMFVYGCAVLVASTMRSLPSAALLLVPAGFGWLASLSTINALVQLSTAPYIKARVLALYQMLFLVAWAIGASIAGAAASTFGVVHTIAAAGGATLCASLLCAWLRLPSYEEESGQIDLHTPPPTGHVAHHH